MSRYQEYLEYLKSDHWADLRQKKFDSIGKKVCQCCDSPNRIHCHHIRYKNYYDCTIADLVVLCETCHAWLHDAVKAKRHALEAYDTPLAIKAIIQWYKTTTYGELKAARKEARELTKNIKKDRTKAWKKECKRVVNRFSGRGYSVEALRSLIAEADILLKNALSGKFGDHLS